MGMMGELIPQSKFWCRLSFIFLSAGFYLSVAEELTSGYSFDLFVHRTFKRFLTCFHFW